LIPLSAVSKIGSFTWFSSGRATIISVPPRASESKACSKGLGDRARAIAASAPAQLLDLCRALLLGGVHHVTGAEFPRHLQLLIGGSPRYASWVTTDLVSR
jgi:hypothetical protein